MDILQVQDFPQKSRPEPRAAGPRELLRRLAQPCLDCQYVQGGTKDGIGIQRDAIDAAFHQETGEFRVIAGRLTTDADLAPRCLGLPNHGGY